MDLELTRILVKVIQNGSFSKAAELLKLPKSTVSKSISRLEKETGTKLIVRTTRSLTLTAAGRAFYESCMGAVQVLEDAQKSLYGQDSILSGLVRITAPEDLGTSVIAPLMAELTKKHNDLNFELHYTDEVIDLVKDGFDVAVRIGHPRESRFKLKRVGEVILIPVASPSYLKDRAKIRQPQDLTEHNCMSLSDQSLSRRWTLKSAKQAVTVSIHPRILSNQMNSLLKVALAGAGVALIPSYLAQPDIEAGRLVHALPDWSSPGLPVSILTPLAASSSARLKITVDELSASLQRVLRQTPENTSRTKNAY